MTQRITRILKNEKAFVGYIMAGDQGMDYTLKCALALIKGGVNVLEIGVPFSDPIADGPVIQRAAQRALALGTTLDAVLELVVKLRQHTDIPVVLFTYINPIFAALKTHIFARAQTAGIDGVLLVDCPIEESKIYHTHCIQHKLAPIYVVTPATSLERVQKIDKQGKGFLYYACRKGTTGMKSGLPEDFEQKVKAIKSTAKLPVVVGFGISQAETAQHILQYADGFVVGSCFVQAMEEKKSPEDLTELARSFII